MTNWRITLADLDYGPEETEAVIRVLQSKWLSMGPVTQEFEAAFAEFVGTKHAVAVSNGTAALHLALAALGIGPGDEVIVPSLTFVATANAVRYCGATPVFADLTSETDWNLSPEDAARKVTPRTKAILPVHYGGNPADMVAFQNLAHEHTLKLVEDAAHAPGAALANGERAGALGDAGCFSFFANKNLATGEGGMVTTDYDEVAATLRNLRSHGMTTVTWQRHAGHAYSYDVTAPGYNYRTTEITAALGLCQLRKLPAGNARRGELTRLYRERLADVPGLAIPFADSPHVSSYHLLPVLLPAGVDRVAVMQALREAGIQSSIHYPPVHLFTDFRQRYGSQEGQLPLTESVAARELTLPLHARMTEEMVEQVAQAVKAATTSQKS